MTYTDNNKSQISNLKLSQIENIPGWTPTVNCIIVSNSVDV